MLFYLILVLVATVDATRVLDKHHLDAPTADSLGCSVPGKQNLSKAGRAVYFLTNSEVNSVACIPIASDGTLFEGSSTITGGNGSSSISSETGLAAGPDALSSQGALTICGNYLFAVNPGSNTLSMMQISQDDPTNLVLLGEPATIPGDFPNTIAASLKNNLVCVGTTGARAGISCASFSGTGLSEFDQLRPLNLHQTTPPIGTFNTISQTFFSEDETRLFVTVKGNPTQNTTGFFSVFPIMETSGKSRALALRDFQSSPNGTAVLFGSVQIPGTSRIFVTDAAFGGAVLTLDSAGNHVSLLAKQQIDGQQATCWAAFSKEQGTVFVTDVGVNRLIEMSSVNAEVISTVDLTNGDPGLIDLQAVGEFVYALSPGNGTTEPAITVIDIHRKQQIQHFQVSHLGASKSSQGLAIFE